MIINIVYCQLIGCDIVPTKEILFAIASLRGSNKLFAANKKLDSLTTKGKEYFCIEKPRNFFN